MSLRYYNLHLQTTVDPQYRRSREWRKSGGIRKLAVLGVIYNLQNPYSGLGNGQRYWGGGDIGRGGIGGDDCTKNLQWLIGNWICYQTIMASSLMEEFVNKTIGIHRFSDGNFPF